VPYYHFTLADVAGSLAAVALFPLFLVIPGYAAAWALDLFSFRRRTTAFRVALSVPLAIALCPIVTYLAGRFGSMHLVWPLYAAAVVYFFAVLRRGRNTLSRDMLPFVGIVLVWLAVVLYAMVDIQSGDRLYLPTSAIDHSLRSAFIHSISSTGIPPQNPFFWPGHGVPLRYHYFWFLMCSLVDQAGGAAVSPRQALMAGTFWCGLGLMGLLAIYLRLAAPADSPPIRGRLRIGLLLAGITGLDLIPAAFFMLLYVKGGINVFPPSVEWWNEHVDWFLYSSVWAPHALAGMIACFVALLLLWKAPQAGGRAALVRYALPAGAALASAVGESIYVGFVFAIFLTLWTGITLWKRWYREAAALMVAGIACVALALRYLADLTGPGTGGQLFSFTVRTFSLAALVPFFKNASETTRLLLVNLPLTPVNYLLEFGFFFAAGCAWWQTRRKSRRPLTREELSCVILAATSILVCTFLRSGVIGCNDLGWRGLLPAEFVLLLWAVELLGGWKRENFLSENQKGFLGLFLILGALGSVCDLALVRIYPMLADAGKVPPLDWMGPDRQVGKRTYASRAAYEWVHDAIPEGAAIQANPKVSFQETFSMYYSERRNIAADTGCLTMFGGDASQCPKAVGPLERMYAAKESLGEACASVPAELLIAKDTDAVWRDHGSWVWTEKPAYANSYVRMFSCRPRGSLRENESGWLRQVNTLP
jgi:hypothetical protein